MKDFLDKNKVLLTGLAGAIAIVLQQYLSAEVIDWKVIGFAVMIAGLSFFAKEWRGQGVTILGIIGSIAGVISEELTKGQVDFSKLILYAIVAVLGAVAPPVKLNTYEQSSPIVEAKDQATAIKEAEKTEEKAK